jgi:hypothetical protein
VDSTLIQTVACVMLTMLGLPPVRTGQSSLAG